MTMNSLNEIADFLRTADYSVILTHQYPDGDTLGSAFALCRALRKLGKHSRVIVNGAFAKRFKYLADGMEEQVFDYQTVITVDIASASLLGELKDEFENIVDVSIDHHSINVPFAKMTYEYPEAAANAENVFKLIKLLGVDIDRETANCIYTGICTDTGCFKFTNVTSETMRIAAELMDLGCDSAEINRVMFDTKSMGRIRMERAALNTLTLHCGDRIAVINTSLAMEKETGADDADMDGLASIPRQVEGVLIGITIKEKGEQHFRVSVRTLNGYNAANICKKFGGGGHHAAAGCSIDGKLEDVKAGIIKAAEEELNIAAL